MRKGDASHNAAAIHKMITVEEDAERQRNNTARLQDIIATCANFKNILEQFGEMEGQRAENDSWEQYMQCNDLPDPKSPVDIRNFMSKFRYYEDLETAKSIDWTLSADERSVLTQNIFQKDLTQKALEKINCSSPGPYFEVNFRNCLEVLRQMDILMDNEVAMERLGPRAQSEIHNVYGEVQREIENLFDRLTYRVLATQKLTMKSIDGIVAMWSHSTDRWRMDLWGLLNVPIIFKQREVPEMTAEFPSIGVKVVMPLSILTDCLTLRCVHTSFDHHSKDARSLELVTTENIDHVGSVDMEESLISEWMIQQEIQDEILMKMRRKYLEYEEMMQLIAERTERAAKKAKTGETVFIPKTPKEVRPIPPGMVPEVYDDFISREQIRYEEYMENCFHPKHLNIFPNEINLREYIIVGGIYSLMFLEVPGQTQFQNFNIILHHDRRVLRIIPDVVTGSSEAADPDRSSESLKARPNLNDKEQPYFNVTIKLPPNLCKWSKPRVCHFLTETERVPKTSMISLRPSLLDTRRLSKDALSETSHRLSSTLKLIVPQSKSRQWDAEQDDTIDFSLDKILNKGEAVSLAAHCMPRIISSFKFPIEFHDKAVEVAPKVKRTCLNKRSEAPEAVEVAVPMDKFDYSMQEQAERLFPRFPFVLPVKFSMDDNRPCNKRSACGVIRAFDTIKRQYEDKPRDLLLQVEPKKKEKKMDRIISPERDEFTVNNNWEEIGSKKNSISTSGIMEPSRRSMKNLKMVQRESPVTQITYVPTTVTHWTARHIIDESIDPTTNTLTFRTDRLGIFGLAFKRYEHFPFGDWCLQPNQNNPDEIIFTLSTQHVSIVLYITSQGLRGYVTDLTTEYIANPFKYMEIKEPISNFRQLRQTLMDKNINIFVGNDASFYISNGYFSVKHLATEIHTYNTMALHCRSMKFYRSSWNRLSERRDLIMDMKVAKDTSDFTAVTVRIKPEKTTFVKVSEMCSDNINNIKLQYEGTWRNVNNYVDLNSAIYSMNPTAQESCNKTATLFIYIKRLLSEIRPLSFA